jgi:multimeric flavodoxin WrbA
MSPNKTLLIAYHSQSGATESLATAVENGALKVEGVSVMRLKAAAVSEAQLEECAAVVICSPEYFGYMAGAIKDLFDRTYEPIRERVRGKPYAVVISAGNDGTGALTSIERIAKGYGFKMVQEPIIVKGEISEADLEGCDELGQTLAAGIEFGIY